jgi:hypothetical protein
LSPPFAHRTRGASGSLTTDGHLMISVRGLVFTNDPEVPPELRGINDETAFRVAPIIFVISGDEEHWFAVTGAETGAAARVSRRR